MERRERSASESERSVQGKWKNGNVDLFIMIKYER